MHFVQESKTITVNNPSGIRQSDSSLGSAPSAGYTYWTLSADPKGAINNQVERREFPPGVFGSSSLLNGKPLPASLSDGKTLEKIPVPGQQTNRGEFVLPPFSVTFAVGPACPA